MMPIDKICGILTRGVGIEHTAHPLGKGSGPRVAGVDVAHQLMKAKVCKGPIAECHRSLKGIAVSFVAIIQQPTQFLLRKKRAVIDTDLPDALATPAQLDHQRAMPKQLPQGDILTKSSPSPKLIVWPIHKTGSIRLQHRF